MKISKIIKNVLLFNIYKKFPVEILLYIGSSIILIASYIVLSFSVGVIICGLGKYSYSELPDNSHLLCLLIGNIFFISIPVLIYLPNIISKKLIKYIEKM